MTHATKYLYGAVWVALGLLLTGCREQTTVKDVQQAREDVREEERDVEQAKDRAAERIDKKEGQVARTTHKQVENIREEQRDVDEAKQKAAEVENQYKTEQSRLTYMKDQDARLAQADERINTLNSRVGKLPENDAERQRLQGKLDHIRDLRRRAGDRLSDLRSARAEDWSTKYASVDTVIKDLFKALDEVK